MLALLARANVGYAAPIFMREITRIGWSRAARSRSLLMGARAEQIKQTDSGLFSGFSSGWL